jgi:hypothetical protein
MKAFVILFISLTLLCGKVFSQEKQFFFSHFVATGFHQFSDVSSINNSLNSSGFPVFPSAALTLRTGRGIGVNRFLVIFEKETMISNSKKDLPDYKAKFKSTGGDLRVGYDLVKNRKVDIYPYLEMGTLKVSYNIDSSYPVSLDQAINNSQHSSYNLTAGCATAATGLLINCQVFSFLYDKFNLLLGGDLQYMVSSKGTWRLDQQIIDVKDVKLGGLSCALSVTMKVNVFRFLRKE